MSNGYGWCQSCGALVFNSPQCHKCNGKVKSFCIDKCLVEQAKRITELKKALSLTKSMVCSGESFTKESRHMVEQALKG